MACTYTYNGRDYASKAELINDVNYDNITARGLNNVKPEEAMWYKFYTAKRIDRTLGDIGMPKDQREATMEVFHFVANKWAKDRGKTPEDFFGEVLRDVRVAALKRGKGRTTDIGNGQYIIELATNSDVTTPLHELAHVFFHTIEPSEVSTVISEWYKATGSKAPTLSKGTLHSMDNLNPTEREQVAEFFATNFERYMAERSLKPTNLINSTLKKFSEFLEDLVSGIQDRIVRLTGRLGPLSPKMTAIYDNVLGIKVMEKVRDRSVASNDSAWARFEKAGIMAKKATYEDMRDKIAGYLYNKYGRGTTVYLSTSIEEAAQAAANKAEVDPDVAYTTAMRYIEEFERVGRSLADIGNPPGTVVLAMSYAAMELERVLDITTNQMRTADASAAAELAERRAELSQQLDVILSALSIMRSTSGATLGLGGHLIQRRWYKPEEVIRTFEKIAGREPTNDEIRYLEGVAEQLSEKYREIETLKTDENSMEEANLVATADDIIANIQNEPMYKDFLKRVNTTAKKVAHRESLLNTFTKGVKKKIQEWFQDSDVTTSSLERAAVRDALFTLIADDSVKTANFSELVESFKDSEFGRTTKFSNDKSLQDTLLSALLFSSKSYQQQAMAKPASDLQVIRREAAALKQLKDIITGTFDQASSRPEVQVSYPQFLDTLRAAINELLHAASMDDTMNDDAYVKAVQLLSSIEKHYEQLDLRDPMGGKALWMDFNKLDKGQLLGMVRDYELAAGIAKKTKRAGELETVIQQLKDGTYEGRLDDVLPRHDFDTVINRLEQRGDTKGITEFIEYKKAKVNESIVRSVFDTLAKDSRFSYSFKDIVDKAVEKLSDMGVQASHNDVYRAVMGNIPKPRLIDTIRTKIKQVKDEGRDLKRLADLLEPHAKKAPPKKPLSSKSKELNNIIESLRRLSRLDASGYDMEVDRVNGMLQSIQNEFQAILKEGKHDPKSVQQVIDKVRELERNRKVEDLKKQISEFRKLTSLVKNAKSVADLPFDVLEKVGGIIPRYLDSNIEDIMREAASARRGAKLTLKQKFMQEQLELIKQGNPDLDKLGQLFSNDNRQDVIDQKLAKLNSEVIMLSSQLKEYYERNAKQDRVSLINSILNVPRVAVLAGDLSFVPYQAGFILNFLFTHPEVAAKAFGRLIMGLVNEAVSLPFMPNQGAASRHFSEVQGKMGNDPYWDSALRANLSLQDPSTLKVEEELQMQNIMEQVGPVDLINSILGKSLGIRLPSDNFVNNATKDYFRRLRKGGTRSYVNFMNTVRFEMYKDGIQKMNLTSNIPTPEEAEARAAWAEYINTLSGSVQKFTGHEKTDRGINTVLEGASSAFIAPRLYASVFKSMMYTTVIPHYIRRIAIAGDRYTPEMEKVYSRMHRQNIINALGMLAYHAAAYIGYVISHADDDDEEGRYSDVTDQLLQEYLNPYSSKFLKIDIGNRTFSLTPMSSYARFAARIVLSPFNDTWWERSKDMREKNWYEHTTDFAKYRVNPIISVVMTNLVYNQDYLGRKLSDDWMGRLSASLRGGLLTVWQQGIIDNYYQGTSRESLITVPLDILGVNAYVGQPFYSYRVKKYKENCPDCETPFRANYRLNKDDRLRGTRKWTHMQDNILSDFSYWLIDNLNNDYRPFKAEMQDKFEEIRIEVFEKYGEEWDKELREMEQRIGQYAEE